MIHRTRRPIGRHHARSALAVCVLAVALAAPASAGASAYQRVLREYGRTGAIPPCMFSSQTLESALAQAGTSYDLQYFGDFTAAIQSALQGRGVGHCGAAGAGQAPAGPAPVSIAAPPLPASVTAATNAPLPFPLALLLGLGIAAGLLTAVAATARARGWDPAWGAYLRHSWGEAEYRLSGQWAEIRDWLSPRRSS